jgi:hypothetical protein
MFEFKISNSQMVPLGIWMMLVSWNLKLASIIYEFKIFLWNCYCASLLKSKHWRGHRCAIKEWMKRKILED